MIFLSGNYSSQSPYLSRFPPMIGIAVRRAFASPVSPESADLAHSSSSIPRKIFSSAARPTLLTSRHCPLHGRLPVAQTGFGKQGGVPQLPALLFKAHLCMAPSVFNAALRLAASTRCSSLLVLDPPGHPPDGRQRCWRRLGSLPRPRYSSERITPPSPMQPVFNLLARSPDDLASPPSS